MSVKTLKTQFSKPISLKTSLFDQFKEITMPITHKTLTFSIKKLPLSRTFQLILTCYLNSLISRLLSTTFFADCDSFIFKSATSVPTLRCFFRIFTSAGRIIISICSVLNSENNCLYSGLIELQK